MNILIVDDQTSVLKGLLNGIHFPRLGFDGVFTAMSAGEALQVLEKHPIQILLTDVEMPGRNGLELNGIVKEKYPDVLRIVLTSHAVFSYAQASVKLGCFDYIVQPAPFEEIEASLQRAVDAVRANYNNRRIARFGHLFQTHESEFLGSIIQKLYSNDPGAVDSCVRLLSQSGHPVDMESTVQLIFADVFAYTRQEQDYPSQSQIMGAISQALKSVPFFAPLDLFVFMNPYRQFSVLLISDREEKLPAGEGDVSAFYQALCRQLPGRPIACYYGDSFPFSDIQLALKAANDHIRDNVAKEPMLSHIALRQIPDGIGVSLPDYQNHWRRLLYTGQKSLLKKDIDFCLDEKIAAMPNRFQRLCDIHQQIIQLFFQYFYDNGVDINALFTDGFTYRDCMDSFSSVEDIKRTVDFLLDAVAASTAAPQELDYVEKAKAFISENYNQLLSVKEVADHVHLNPEYFTRRFKKETGKSIKNYIVDCKMTLAKDLLATSSLPISMVALEVGYSNFSHFTQIFKKLENMTPSEYRILAEKKKAAKEQPKPD
ncbi:AraC family transcriptional regulator [Acutalibacter caecimuris]|uniref:AraC family transcriptional regulator n=1 Tax=Acutalibacter caecimuris TaxID=3093657 RepID=UPI002AC921EB|nr:AraC family transcriptional regulator [Acutalibacter sp. M00118]